MRGMLQRLHHVQVRRLFYHTSSSTSSSCSIPYYNTNRVVDRNIVGTTTSCASICGGRYVDHYGLHRRFQSASIRKSSSDSGFWNVGISSLSGFWSHLTNDTVRDEFESYVERNVINQEIFTQNMNGRIQMWALLHGLMNPLLDKYKFDSVEFIEVVGPALQKYHETLLQIMTDAPTKIDVGATTLNIKETIIKQKIEDDSDQEDDDEMAEKRNSWVVEAERDPKSLVGRFVKMVTDENLMEQHHNAQMIHMFSQMGIPATMKYVSGSCAVEYVSLLNIKAVEIDDSLYEQTEHPEFAASNEHNLPVLARIQVLYKLSRKFQRRNKEEFDELRRQSPTSASESYKAINTDVASSSAASASSTAPIGTNTDNVASTISTTSDSDPEKIARDNSSKQNETTTQSSTSDIDTSTNSTTTTSTKTTFDDGQKNDPEIYSESRLGVATFEGWLHGGSTAAGTSRGQHHHHHQPQQQLRWRVASASESNHFW